MVQDIYFSWTLWRTAKYEYDDFIICRKFDKKIWIWVKLKAYAHKSWQAQRNFKQSSSFENYVFNRSEIESVIKLYNLQ